ncbi:MAG TPA: CHC2 zinc finger domain-containing protein [Puia sp.]|nr:CHC2 zinc finger domain-containing protein [Puia sp.]
MDIPEIKRQLPIGQVLEHYGLRPDGHERLLCPFHPDKTPSLQIYPKTNTFCCFSSNCTAGTGDTIQFIQLMEKCSKHEALAKATALCGGDSIPLPSTATTSKLFIEAGDEPEKQAVLGKLFSYCSRALPLTKKAVEYLQGRGIDYTQHEAGYNSGGLHEAGKHPHLVAAMEKYGLLKRRPAGGYSVWARDCIIFPLRNAEHKIVSLYGRSITNDTDQRHFYLAGREGLYPGYPKTETTRLLLTESVIDAVTLLQQHELSIQYGVLALYGTNGLTEEHLTAILALKQLQEIILMLDGDEAGRAATAKHATALRALLPDVQLTTVGVPDGEDVNSLLETHADPRVLADLIGGRTDFSFSIEPSKHNSTEQPKSLTTAAEIPPAAPTLVTANPELLLYDTGELLITVLGGIRLTGLDRMKVTLKVEHQAKPRLPVRHHLDLYNHPHTEQLVGKIAEAFDISTQAATHAIATLTGELESYRARRMESLQPRAEERLQLSPAQRQAATQYLKQANLLERTGEDIGSSGIVGEETNRLIAWLVYSSRKLSVPLHLLFLGSSGSGKTWLQERVSELIPPEDKIEITQITENAFYYFRQDELSHRLLLIEDLDGAEASLYPLRELQTKRRITKTVTLKDSKGNLKTITLTVEGPVSVSGCTTREKVYEDNANRCLLLYVDGSTGQDRRILDYQTRAAAGTIDRENEQHIRRQLQDVQRVLVPVTVINPYAGCLELPEQVFKPRRTMTLLLAFIEAITFYHQYQRPVKRDAQGHPYIESTTGDIEAAFGLLKDVIFHKSDELAKASRSFLEGLKALLQAQGKTSFQARDIRRQLRLAPTTLKRYLIELERYGYLKVSRPGRHTRFEYSITDPTEYDALRSAIDRQLQQVLDRIRERHRPTGPPLAH